MTEPNNPAQLDQVHEAEYEIESMPDEVTTTDKSYSQGRLVLRRFLRHRGAMISLTFLILIALLAITSIGFGPIPGWWSKNHVDLYPIQEVGGAPTLTLWPFSIGEHPFGQSTIGKDYFALVMLGTQNSLAIAFTVGIAATIIGTLVGAAAGYFRGLAEAFLMRVTDLFIIIPTLVLAAVLGRMAGNVGGIFALAGMLALVSWTGLARLVRGEVLSLREREFVAAARAVGTSPWRIIVRHILPNALGTIIVNATLLISAAILVETALSYLGFGVRPPNTSLGLLISENQNALSTRPWLFWWPGVFIVAVALCVNFIGDGLRDAFDPRQQMD
ncbi:ABC transporter permease [Tessaracoccus lapidicaptus]|uniref:ABC transporter permease n=1 Tax=Tessaracoccus lapidicaptus TaxID=1427523 RepID=A0A1C0AQ88_9ACTN|nr:MULTISPECIES: ABC transporter permease [Tessaracoccus]AQX15221.1 ABC transporter permease [Tessaracoccus sp. T2.5-30]OCL36467.1 ABC transporter permease [Tessaracoccus lapidicaptus]VEP39467.1 Putative peptide transport permease protein [Tessaracoccus lapidicaptus]